MGKAFIRLYILMAITTLVACGGDSAGDPPYDPDPTWSTVSRGLVQSNTQELTIRRNVDFEIFQETYYKVKRWDIDPDSGLYIPVQINGVRYVEETLDLIEDKMGFQMFDRTSLVGLAPEDIHAGLIFREGTAKGPEDKADPSSCGHVGDKDSSVNFPYNWYGYSGTNEAVLSVNIGSVPGGGQNCTVDAGLVFHEVLHALGMGYHFQGFGESPQGVRLNHINRVALTVLYNMYHNDLLAHQDDLVLQFPFGQDSEDAKIEGRVGVQFGNYEPQTHRY